MKPLPRASSGSVVTLDADLYNYIAENLERLDKWVVQPPLNLHQTAAGNLLSLAPSQNELALVAIIGTETGGGRYKGSILSGGSTGNLTNNFQLQPSSMQSDVDGPAYQKTSGVPNNNALVINTLEQYVSGSHLLWVNEGDLFYAMGRVMGQTTESTPRTIMYLNNQMPIIPVIAKISGVYSSPYGGVYYGRIVQGQFNNSQNSYTSVMASYAGGGVPTSDTCWIRNNWEQTYIPNSGHNALATGTFVQGLMTGFPVGPFPGGTATSDVWYMVDCWFPPQSAAVSFATTTAVQTPNGSYGSNEQTMLTNLKSDVTNLRAELTTLYANLRSAGYSL